MAQFFKSAGRKLSVSMTMRGSCSCKNFQVTWHTVDYSLVPRACQCDYCLSKSAAYVSKSGTRFEVLIHQAKLHDTIQHGSNNAVFHECASCKQLVFVSAEIDGELYGALNAHCMQNKLGFVEALQVDHSGQTGNQKVSRWRENWCHAVVLP